MINCGSDMGTVLMTILLLALVTGSSWGQTPASGSQESTLTAKRISVSLGEKTIKAVLADTDPLRTQGFLGWTGVTDEEGMLLYFQVPGEYAIHMQGMKFPIDALWIDRTGKIQLIYENIPPDSGVVYPSMFPCKYCLEVAAGFCKRYGVKMGMSVRFDTP